MKNKRLDKSLRKQDKRKENRIIYLSGTLGIPLNGQKIVEVPNRPGFVFVRLKDNQSELIQAYNSVVSPVYDLPVLVTRQTGVYRVTGRNETRNLNQWGQAPYLPKHGAQHSFNPDLNIGGDIVWVYSRQFMPLLAYPSGSSGSPNLTISPYLIRDLSGNWKYVGNTGTPSMAPYVPTTGSRMVLVYLDTVSGNPYLLINSGTYVDISITGSSQLASYIPQTTNPNYIPLAAVRLTSGTTSLTWDNVYDVRPFFSASSSTGTGGGGGLSSTIQIDDLTTQVNGTGTVFSLTTPPTPSNNLRLFYNGVRQRYTYHYVVSGSSVYTLFTPSTGSVLIADYNDTSNGGGGGFGGIAAWDEGIPIGTGTTLNFVGAGVTASISGTILNINVPGSSISTGTLDARYLKLDASNDPLTGGLDINNATSYGLGVVAQTYAAGLSSNLGYPIIDSNQIAHGIDSFNPAIRAIRYSDDGSNFNRSVLHFIDLADNSNFFGGTLVHSLSSGTGGLDLIPMVGITPYPVATGTAFFINSQTPVLATGTFLLLQHQGRNIFAINGSGTAFSNGVPLIKEAPIDGNSYVRKNGGWILGTGGGGGGGGIGIVAWDDGVYVGTGTVIDFGTNLTASISGTVIHVDAAGGSADNTYLRLDTANDPLTGSLDVVVPDNNYGEYIISPNSSPLYLDQILNSDKDAPVIYADRYSTGTPGIYSEAAYFVRDNVQSAQFRGGTLRHIFYSGSVPYNPRTIVDINPYAHATTGTPFFMDVQTSLNPVSPFFLLYVQGREIFRINGSGTAYSNSVALVKEAPADGNSYVRKNSGWVLESQGNVANGILGIAVQDEGVFLGTGTTLNFVGAGVTVTMSGTIARVNVPSSGGDDTMALAFAVAL